jgi:hypothetical protein
VPPETTPSNTRHSYYQPNFNPNAQPGETRFPGGRRPPPEDISGNRGGAYFPPPPEETPGNRGGAYFPPPPEETPGNRDGTYFRESPIPLPLGRPNTQGYANPLSPIADSITEFDGRTQSGITSAGRSAANPRSSTEFDGLRQSGITSGGASSGRHSDAPTIYPREDLEDQPLYQQQRSSVSTDFDLRAQSQYFDRSGQPLGPISPQAPASRVGLPGPSGGPSGPPPNAFGGPAGGVPAPSAPVDATTDRPPPPVTYRGPDEGSDQPRWL